jgi:multicomponent Na+:H+ antiporter subunit B
MILRTGKLFAVIVMSGGYSLTSAAIFVNLDAVDVAFTEAAVGAGISTVLFLAAMAFLPAEEKPARKNSTGVSHTLIATLVCMTAGLLLIAAALDLPAFGDPNAPAQVHVAPRYLQESGDVLHIPNVVTTVLASYRGFDTLGETIVVFTAGLGVLMLLAGATRTRRQSPTTKTTSNTKTKSKKGAQNG